MALESDQVAAEAVDAMEFPRLADLYQVRGVPRTVVGRLHIEGAVPEAQLLARLKGAL